jgi:hypothetical protein
MYSITPQFEAERNVADALRALLQRLEAAASAEVTAEDVLERAAAYEAGQPSYAADLRAAAEALAAA